ncbi:MAG TPA: YggT family protein [Dictyobacter sp.]|jgi:YggT family protein|nr:YggT family protein [Dictyobacter sp.]
MFVPPPLPIQIVSLIIQAFFGIIILAMLIRAVASWFHMDERYAFIRFLARLTDPFIAPTRRIIGQVGVMDFSFIVTWITLMILEALLLQSMPIGW